MYMIAKRQKLSGYKISGGKCIFMTREPTQWLATGSRGWIFHLPTRRGVRDKSKRQGRALVLAASIKAVRIRERGREPCNGLVLMTKVASRAAAVVERRKALPMASRRNQ